ncbi:nucleotidyltransferase domain-containing protein [Pedobacter yulinensis]|nr:nucleotidyltransferase domain-containing protein [Pedobacter yulinensis]
MEQLSGKQLELLQQITAALQQVPGIAAVVLGGSYAAGQARPGSDLDLGIYYSAHAPFAVDHIRQIADRFSAGSDPVVTGLYEWGPWVNGGAWIQTAAGKVDFLYRSLEQLAGVVADAEKGLWAHHFDQQPPYGFRSVIYLAELRVCQPLFDPEQKIAGLKTAVAAYPAPLKQTIVQDCLWLAEFTLMQCAGFAAAADVYNTTGCFTRAANYLVHALYALNESFPLGDKRALNELEQMAVRPRNFSARLNRILGAPGQEADPLVSSLVSLKQLWKEVVGLCGGTYRSRFGAD